LQGFASGVRTIILRDVDPPQILKLIEIERVNHLTLVPAVIRMLVQAEGVATTDFSSLQTLTYGASPIAETLLEQARRRFGCAFFQFYGMTETCGLATVLTGDDHAPQFGKLHSCGRPCDGLDVEVVDENGSPTPINVTGELVIRGPTVMRGYWNQPAATNAALREGWMHTGDAAFRDEDGYLFIFDRIKDMIVTGGENVYPAEVEGAIFGHPQVLDVAVIGVPDERWGEAVKAVVVLKPGVNGESDDIIRWARNRIASFKAPRSVDFVSAIPRNPTGKILRKDIRAPYWRDHQRRVG